MSFRTNLRTKVDIYVKRYAGTERNSESTSLKISVKRKSIDNEKLCFVCQEKWKSSDSFPINQGELGRYTKEYARNRIKERTSIFLEDEEIRFHNAATKLNILLA